MLRLPWQVHAITAISTVLLLYVLQWDARLVLVALLVLVLYVDLVREAVNELDEETRRAHRRIAGVQSRLESVEDRLEHLEFVAAGGPTTETPDNGHKAG